MTDSFVLLLCVIAIVVSYKQMTKPRWRKYQLYKVGKPLDLEMSSVHYLSLDGGCRLPMLFDKVTCRYESNAVFSSRVIEARFVERDPNFFVLTGVKPE